MKKTYITPTFIVEEIVDDMDILAGSPDPDSIRDITGGGPTGGIRTTTGSDDDDDDASGTAAKGSNLFLSYDEEW